MVLLLLFGGWRYWAPKGQIGRAVVVQEVDAESIDLMMDSTCGGRFVTNKRYRLRLLGIEAIPEKRQQARRVVRSMCPRGHRVMVEFHRDNYSAVYLWAKQGLVNEHLVRAGAAVATGEPIDGHYTIRLLRAN